MENGDRAVTPIDSMWASGPDFLVDEPKRTFLRAAGLLVAGLVLPQSRADENSRTGIGSGHKVILVIVGGIRRAETFSRDGLENIPHLSADLLPRSLFYPHARNEGVTAHFNAISSILTGNWQRVDDWGKLAPTTPTLFEQFRKGLPTDRSDTWNVASNKALTSLIGASLASDNGPAYGANVVFPKQLMLMAVEDAFRSGRTANLADRSKVEAELESAMEGSNCEGWDGTCLTPLTSLIHVCRAASRPPSQALCAGWPYFRGRTHFLHDSRSHAQVLAARVSGGVF